MRLSAELIQNSEQRTNPLGERELVLRGMGISVLEHLGAARDDFDVWDFSRNRLVSLENLPRVKRLSSLLCGSNAIETVRLNTLPDLKHLIMSDNRVGNLAQVKNIGQACPKLQTLCLDGNPVTRQQHYRLYTILQIPTIQILDFMKVKPNERAKAQRLGQSAAGAALEEDVVKTFEPGQPVNGNSSSASSATKFTDEEKERIRNLLANASSAKEIEAIESAIASGMLPPGIQPSKRQKVI